MYLFYKESIKYKYKKVLVVFGDSFSLKFNNLVNFAQTFLFYSKYKKYL